MRARRSAALLLTCVLGLFLFAAPQSGAAPHHGAHRATMVAPSGSDAAHAWRTTHDDALTVHAHQLAEAAAKASDPVRVASLASATAPSARGRGPPGVAHG